MEIIGINSAKTLQKRVSDAIEKKKREQVSSLGIEDPNLSTLKAQCKRARTSAAVQASGRLRPCGLRALAAGCWFEAFVPPQSASVRIYDLTLKRLISKYLCINFK